MTPDFRILAGSVDVTETIRTNLCTLKIEDKAGMEADQLDITITDPTSSIALPRRGAVLSVSLGWKGQPLVDKGQYTVDEVGVDGPPDVISIVARAADFRSSLKEEREKSYATTTLGAILATIAERNGLKAAVHPGLAATAVAHLDQTNESDANLVTRLGEDYGAVATIKTGHLLFVPRGTGLTASGIVLPTVRISRQDGDRYSYRAIDRDGSRTGVQTRWHDLKTGSNHYALAGKTGSVKTLKRVYPTEAEAQAAADAAWGRQQTKAHEFTFTLALGRPEVLACAPLILSGLRRDITATTWITGAVTHEMAGSGGFTTAINATEVIDAE